MENNPPVSEFLGYLKSANARLVDQIQEKIKKTDELIVAAALEAEERPARESGRPDETGRPDEPRSYRRESRPVAAPGAKIGQDSLTPCVDPDGRAVEGAKYILLKCRRNHVQRYMKINITEDANCETCELGRKYPKSGEIREIIEDITLHPFVAQPLTSEHVDHSPKYNFMYHAPTLGLSLVHALVARADRKTNTLYVTTLEAKKTLGVLLSRIYGDKFGTPYNSGRAEGALWTPEKLESVNFEVHHY